MKRTIRFMHTRGLKITLCLVFVLTILLANAVIEPPVAHAQRYIVDISLGDNPVPSGTGTSVTININDDWIYDTYNTSATGFSLRAQLEHTCRVVMGVTGPVADQSPQTTTVNEWQSASEYLGHAHYGKSQGTRLERM